MDLDGAKSIAGIVRKSTVRGNVLDRISFSYDYFKESSPQNGTSGKRLKLTGVKVNSKIYELAYEIQNCLLLEAFLRITGGILMVLIMVVHYVARQGIAYKVNW